MPYRTATRQERQRTFASAIAQRSSNCSEYPGGCRSTRATSVYPGFTLKIEMRGAVLGWLDVTCFADFGQTAFMTRAAFCPPNPNEFEIARVTRRSRASFGT